MSQPKIDPHLAAQLKETSAKDEVQAVVTLHPDDPSQPAPSPERMEEMARDLVARVTKSSGVAPKKVNVFKYLGSFAIAAEPAFIEHLVGQPEVKSAMSNRRTGTAAVA
jgi:hypothetical protein